MSKALSQSIIKEIQMQGSISTAHFMERVISHYYANQQPFGQDGDFITAPEVSQLFGEMIGGWLADLWFKMNKPEVFHLVEIGPGRGTLMSDILRVFQSVPGLLDAAKIHLVETSDNLRGIQQQALVSYNVSWHQNINEIDFFAPVLFVANELFDALSVFQYQINNGVWFERKITWSEDKGFSFLLAPTAYDFGLAEEGSIKEISPASQQFMRDISVVIEQQLGAGLFIDYGYIEEGFGDTIQALKSHEFCSIFEHIGEADVTAHVDFLSLSEAASAVHVWPFAAQGAFLSRLGISLRADVLMQRATDQQKIDVGKSLKRLIDAQEMGDLFKVMAVTHDKGLKPEGFE